MSQSRKSTAANARVDKQTNGAQPASSLSTEERDDIFSEKYAWVAVGACGLASVAFGPEESFKAQGD
jgi:hypothetical protein